MLLISWMLLVHGQVGVQAGSACPVDLSRFPDRDRVNFELDWNTQAQSVCRFERSMSRLREYEWYEFLGQLQDARRPWEYLERACWHENRHVRDCHRDLLHDLIGCGRFARGAMPPAVPVHLQALFVRPDLPAGR